MRIALIPMRVVPGDNAANQKTMAHWVERLHASADLLVFPQIEVAPMPPGSDAQALSPLNYHGDIVSAFAGRRSVLVAAGFWETRPAGHFSMLLLADRTGQMDARTRQLDAEPAPDRPGAALLSLRTGGLAVAVAMSDDLYEASLVPAANRLPLRALILPVYQARAAVSPTAEPLAELLPQMSAVARQTRAYLLAVNSICADPRLEFAPDGGALVVDPQGQIVARRPPGDDTPLEVDIA